MLIIICSSIVRGCNRGWSQAWATAKIEWLENAHAVHHLLQMGQSTSEVDLVGGEEKFTNLQLFNI